MGSQSNGLLRLLLTVCIGFLLPTCGVFSQLLPVERLQPGIVLYPTPEDRFIRINTDGPDLQLHYRQYAGSGENIVFIHGFSSSTYTWEDMIAELQKLYRNSGRPLPRIWSLDMKGFGWSDKPPSAKYDPVTLSEEVSAWMDKVGIDTATVVGHSLGGAVTLLLARNHPQKATRLVLIDSVGYPRRAALTHAELVLSQPAARIFFSRESTKAILHSMFYDPARVTETRADAYFNRLRSNGGLNAQEQVAVFLTAESQHGYLVDLAAIQQETLLLWGREDKWIPYKYACCFKKIMPRASLDILPQCGHLLQEEKPAVAAELLYGFLNKTPHQYQTCPCEQN